MKRRIIDLHLCLNILSVIILFVGLGSAILIYRADENNSNDVLGYEQSGDSIYPIQPEDSKRYLHDLELFGGKANVLVDQFMRWFVELWHGKSLAIIIGCVSILVSFGVSYASNRLPSRSTSDLDSERDHGRRG